MNTESASDQDGCFPPESFYDTNCSLPGDYYYGCFYPNPCISAMSAATTTQTTTRTIPAQTKTVTPRTSASSTAPRSTSNLPTSSSQTAATSSPTLAETATPAAAVSMTPATTSSVLAQTTSLVAAVSTSPANPSFSPPPSHVDTAAVAAGTVGAVLGAVIALTLMLLVLRWRKRRRNEGLRATKHENEGGVLGIDAIGAGHGSESAPACRDVDPTFPSHPGTSNAGSDRECAYKLSDSPSTVPSLSPTQPGPKMPGPTPEASGRQTQLAVPAFHSPVELSPKTERPLIDIIPYPVPSPSRVKNSGQGGLEPTADRPVMHPNLDLTGEEVGEAGPRKTGGSHIMSWMSYDDDGYGSGPER